MKRLPISTRLLTLLLAGALFSASGQFHAADTAPPKAKIGSLNVSKILFLGNSITLHGPAPEIGWTGNWGMAASAEELDYVHLLTAEVTKAGGTPKIKVRNIAEFERGYDSYDIEASLKEELSFAPDLVIVAIGENVADLTTSESQVKFAAAFGTLLAAIKERKPQAIFVRSGFWPNPTKDEIMRKGSSAVNATFIDISKLAENESNFARSERVIEHAGVAAHPGDQGMRAISDAIFSAIQKRAKLSPAEK